MADQQNIEDCQSSDDHWDYMDDVDEIVDEQIVAGRRRLTVKWAPSALSKPVLQRESMITFQEFDMFKKIRNAGRMRIINWIDKHACTTKDPSMMLYIIGYGADEEQTIVDHKFLKNYFEDELLMFLAQRLAGR